MFVVFISPLLTLHERPSYAGLCHFPLFSLVFSLLLSADEKSKKRIIIKRGTNNQKANRKNIKSCRRPVCELSMLSMPLASKILRSEIKNVVWVMRMPAADETRWGNHLCFVVAKKEVRHAMVGGDADIRSVRLYMCRVPVPSPEQESTKKHKVPNADPKSMQILSRFKIPSHQSVYMNESFICPSCVQEESRRCCRLSLQLGSSCPPWGPFHYTGHSSYFRRRSRCYTGCSCSPLDS